ncbi:MAG: glycosyltransferase family 4 protein [Candidatus Binatia bacterium]
MKIQRPDGEKDRLLKVLRIVTRLNVGGASHNVALSTAGLNGLFEIKLLTGAIDDQEGDMSFLADRCSLPLIRIESLSNGSGPLGDLKAFWRLYQIIKKEKPDLVHLHQMKARFFGGLAARLARVPVVIETFHGNLFSGYYGKFKTAAILGADRFLGWLIMDRVIAISETQREELLQYRVCPIDKIEVIPLGLDLDKFVNCSRLKGELRRELGLSEQTVILGTVGRLVPIKGLTYLLDAIQRVARSTKIDFCHLIVGDGPLRRDLESRASSLGLEKRVRFLGWRFDLEKIYADLDVAVLSSLNEGTPVSLIEAMAAGRAVVATRVGGVPDVVENGATGLLVPSKDPKALADALRIILEDANLRSQLGVKASSSVYPKYTVSRLIEDTKNLYLSLVPSDKRERDLVSA